jgi:hypothetical protein
MNNSLTFLTEVIETPIPDLKQSDQHIYAVRQTINVDELVTHKDLERLLLSNIFSRSMREIDEIEKLSLCVLCEDENDYELGVMKEVFAESQSRGKYFTANFSELDRITFNIFNDDRERSKCFTKIVEDVSAFELSDLRNESQNDDGTFSKSWSECFDEIKNSSNKLVA